MPDALLIPSRFNGPAASGNGGWVSGAVAALVADAPSGASPGATSVVEVTLRLPPPLETPLGVETSAGLARALLDDALVAEAHAVDRALAVVDAVPADEAEAARARYAGLQDHPFPTCYVCGPAREVGDGLRIFPGPVGEHVVASTWTPQPTDADGSGEIALPVAWAALDCPGGWSVIEAGRPRVLGRMAARVDAAPRVGETHVVVGALRGIEGRKAFTASTLYDADGRVVATAEQIWIAVDADSFNAGPA